MGSPEKGELVTLLKALVRIDGLRWIRLFYTYPTDFTDALIDLIAEEEKICRYIDLPLQHIDDTILKKMNRKGKRRDIERLIQKLRDRIPGVTLRSTFIVGFPGETEKEFRTLSEFIREIEFDRLGIFTYSLEEGTSAHPLGDPIAEGVKIKRQKALLEMQRKISRRKQRKMIGSVQTVLVDGLSKESDLLLEGRLEGQAPDVDGVVLINDLGGMVGGRNGNHDTGGEVVNPGRFVSVRITAAHDYDLVGEIVEGKDDLAPSQKEVALLPMISPSMHR
ncbi:MAG: radical SAM protein [Candidatus Manganitrophus sp.]|nr:MAG: radical SAM protein [Candidatus Manganitrophus sp.]